MKKITSFFFSFFNKKVQKNTQDLNENRNSIKKKEYFNHQNNSYNSSNNNGNLNRKKEDFSISLEVTSFSCGVDSYGLSCESTATNTTVLNINKENNKESNNITIKNKIFNLRPMGQSQFRKFLTSPFTKTNRSLEFIQKSNLSKSPYDMSVILHPTAKQTASVIFLHGLGDTGLLYIFINYF
jgi:hypothetical protein